MSLPGCLVIERSHDWLIVVGNDSEPLALDVQPSELAVCADRMVKTAGLKNPACVLAPDSTSCFFASLSPSDEIDVRDRAALTYELEDHLPIDAESMVADFAVVPSPQGTKMVSAIALQVDRWHKIAEAMESVGLPVRSIIPRAVLATRAVLANSDLGDVVELNETFELLLIDQDQCDSLTLQNQTIAAWKHFAVQANPLRRHQLLDGGAKTMIVAGADLDQQSIILAAYPDARLWDESSDELVIRGAILLLANRSSASFDLRRDALGPSDPWRAIQKQIRFAGLAATACLLSLAVGGWWRTSQIETETANVRAQQQQLFSAAFPDSRVPGAVLRRVRSEHTKVLGSRGETSEVDIPVPAAKIVRELLSALPQNVRFRVKSIRILNGQVDLDLQVRSPVDAGALATSLSSAGFEVKPPGTTQKDAQTFESLLEAKWIGLPKTAAPLDGDVSIMVSIDSEVAG